MHSATGGFAKSVVNRIGQMTPWIMRREKGLPFVILIWQLPVIILGFAVRLQNLKNVIRFT